MDTQAIVPNLERKNNNQLTDEESEKVNKLINEYIDAHKRINISAISRLTGISSHIAIKKRVQDCIEARKEDMDESDRALITKIREKLYSVLEETEESTPEVLGKYGLKDANEKQKLDFELELVDKIINYGKFEQKDKSVGDTNNSINIFNLTGMNGRVKDLLLQRLEEKKNESDK